VNGYITPKDMLAGHQHEIQAERDRKLEAARQQADGRIEEDYGRFGKLFRPRRDRR
jgi:hypothetical protein